MEEIITPETMHLPIINKKWREWDLPAHFRANPRPRAYESYALPLGFTNPIGGIFREF